MTKTWVLGEKMGDEPAKSRIELCFYVGDASVVPRISDAITPASDFDNLVLIATGEEYDTIAAWCNGDGLDLHCVYLGHWNDGVV